MTNARYQLPVVDTLSAAWNKVYGVKGTIWAGMLVYFLLIIGAAVISTILSMVSHGLGAVANVVMQIYLNVLMFGMYYIGYLRAKDAPVSYKNIFRGVEDPKRTLKTIVAIILVWLIMLPPVILAILTSIGAGMSAVDNSVVKLLVFLIYAVCAVAGIFLLVRSSLAVLFVLDRDANPIDAIKLSFRATKHNVLSIIGIYALSILIVLVSAIPLGIGLIWTLPFSYITIGMVYKNLQINA